MIHFIQSIHEIEQHLDSESILLLDLDNTIIRARSYYGSIEWEDAFIKRLMDQGVSAEEAENQGNQLFHQSQYEITIEFIEKEFPLTISHWKKILPIVGLTARDPKMNIITHQHLETIDLSFSFHEHSHPPSNLHKGILFCGDVTKGEILFGWLESTTITNPPKRILFVDDKKSHLEEIFQACQSKGIEFVGFHIQNKPREDLPGVSS